MTGYKNSEEEKLKSLLGKNENYFQVPPGYFGKLPEEVMDKINLIPDFGKTAVDSPFSVPDGYFEKLPGKISDRIVINRTGSHGWLASLLRPKIAIPAVFAVVLLIAGIYFYSIKSVTYKSSSEISANDIENSGYIFRMDEELFVDALEDGSGNSKDESFEEYLIDNNIDLSQIENRL